MMDKLIGEAHVLVGAELARAVAKYGPGFHSPEEGYGVIAEEIMEAQEETALLPQMLTALLHGVHDGEIRQTVLDDMESAAVRGACEMLQVAAMCRKFRQSGGVS